MTTDAFLIRRIGIAGHEIVDPDGRIIAWAATEPGTMDHAAMGESSNGQGKYHDLEKEYE